MEQFKDIEFWTKNLGHLPIHLKTEINNKFIMLNGISGNFCIHISEDEDEQDTYFSQSWSSNTKNFILVKDNNLKLFNWHKETKVEEVSLKSIHNNFEKFYNYLVSKSYRSDRDVIPVIIDTFKQFRTLTTEYHNPVKALNLLFVLLAGLEEGNIQNLDRNKWNISDIEIPQDFERFLERFQQGTNNIEPDLNLILRHSAGALFQEAQKEVIFCDSQMDLWGTFSGNAATKSLLYSSIHYTPSYLARSIVENTLRLLELGNLTRIKILDPACGSAEFLIEVLKQLKEKDYEGIVEIKGYDTSETAITTSTFLLSYEKRTVWGERLHFEVKKVDDSLTEIWDNDNTIILMNPPFVSWEQLNDKEKRDAVRFSLGVNFKGKPNQASAFFYKALQNIADGGVLGSVVPSNLFTSDAYLKLRNEIIESINIELLGKLGNFVFEDALTDVSIFVGQKPKKISNLPTLLWTRNEKGTVHDALRELRKMQHSDDLTRDKVDFSIFKPNHFPVIADSWKPISFKENSLIKDLKLYLATKKLSTIGSIFNVQQGVRPGNKAVFVISQQDYLKLPTNEQGFFLPSIDNDAIQNGLINIKNFVWYPYDTKSGESLINNEIILQESVPNYYTNILLPNKQILTDRKKQTPNWWSLSDRAPRLLPLNMKIVSTEFGNSKSFGFDKIGSYIVERGYSWQSKQKMNEDEYYFYLAIFSSPFFDKLLAIYSKQFLAAWDLGKKYTKEIPIPDVHNEAVKNLSSFHKLVELGKRLSEGDTYVKAILDDAVSIYYPEGIS